MTYVLGAMEDSEGEAVEEVTWRQESLHWPQAPASALLQEEGDILQLGDLVQPIAAVLDEEGQHVVVLLAGIEGVQRDQVAPDLVPGMDLLLRVLHPWNLVAVLVR